MKAMVLTRLGGPLELVERPVPTPQQGQILVKVNACGVCRTDLHLVDGELPDIHLPIIPGHEVVGTVEAIGAGVVGFATGERVGIPWLGATCGTCWYCRHDVENLCDAPGFTGYTIDGGYGEYIVSDSNYCFALPESYSDIEAAPLLCAGLIGHRCLKAAGPAEHLGIYGFGAAAHIVVQIALFEGRNIYAFTRAGDETAQGFARQLGACWAGSSDSNPPRALDAAIIFAPVGALVPAALRAVRKGGIVVCGGIYMSDIPQFPYEIIWGERTVRSVANLTRRDAVEFLEIAPQVPVKTHVVPFHLTDANEALGALRAGRLSGAAVLTV